MVFSSATFLYLFLPGMLALYFLAPERGRNLALLLASLFFYAWGEPLFVLLMLASIVFNYVIGRRIGSAAGGSRARLYLAIGVAGNLSALGWFKYAGFFANVIEELLGLPLGQAGSGAGLFDAIHLPIGISFFTFQALSYLIDVYRRDVEPQRRFGQLALYIALFPQLIAGPIVRYRQIRDQLRARSVDVVGFADGGTRFLIGLGKKVLIANTLAEKADAIFALDANALGTGTAWLGVLCYTLQIYFDFSGYSDMAIGLGRIFGFRFQENFAHPYVSSSITEFWRRWHISLSTWLRDYLYVPLGGNRKGTARTYLNLLIVFFLCGLWHGASFNFIVWGLFHGFFLVVERAAGVRVSIPGRALLRHAYCMLVVMVGWTIFRADTLGQAASFLTAMSGLGATAASAVVPAQAQLDRELVVVLVAAAVGATPWPARIGRRLDGWRRMRPLVTAAELGGLLLVLLATSMKLAAGTHNPFIYFRF